MPPSRPVVYVCRGDDCRDDRKRHRALLAAANEAGDVELVGCQKICAGPVAGTVVDGRLEWFRKVRRRAREDLAAWLAAGTDGPLPPAVAERRVPKRSGKLR